MSVIPKRWPKGKQVSQTGTCNWPEQPSELASATCYPAYEVFWGSEWIKVHGQKVDDKTIRAMVTTRRGSLEHVRFHNSRKYTAWRKLDNESSSPTAAGR